METSPPPDYTVFELDSYLHPLDQLTIPFRLSKGCYWRKCAFCNARLFSTRDYQQPDPEHIYGQLKQTVESSSIGKVVFSDESAQPKVLETICERMLEDGLNIHWSAHTRIDPGLTPDRCRVYRQAGCRTMSLGVESLEDRLLSLMRKGTTVALIEKVLGGIEGLLPFGAYMIVGFPTETEAEARRSFAKLQVMQQKGWLYDFYYSLFHLIPDSDVWENPERYAISDFNIDSSLDLNPESLNFRGTGMPRVTALKACGTMNSKGKFSPEEVAYPKEVMVAEEKVVLRFELSSLVDRIYGHWDLSARTEMLRLGIADDRVVPMKPTT
jgi:radical SAM superfamily enzyme YgiQ (UPF0313 family)